MKEVINSNGIGLVNLLVTLITSLIITMVVYPIVIPFLQKIKFGQSIREDGPQSHLQKTGTPTMGGVVFVLTAIIVFLVLNFRHLDKYEIVLVILAFIGFSLIGFIDDFLIVVKKSNDGLSAKLKIVLQVAVTIVFFMLFREYSTYVVWIPIINYYIDFGPIFYFAFILIMFVAESNATNLTDGLDGLLAGCAIIVIVPFIIISWLTRVYQLALFLVAVEGSLLGYLFFNRKPARIFMGDTGSLALGGLSAASSMVLKVEFLLVIAGGIFVLEVVSVILQVVSFKTRGKRIFKMAPFHHHLELCGINEEKIVYLFWFITAILSTIAFLIWYFQVYLIG